MQFVVLHTLPFPSEIEPDAAVLQIKVEGSKHSFTLIQAVVQVPPLLLPILLALLSFFYMIQLHVISLNKLAFI